MNKSYKKKFRKRKTKPTKKKLYNKHFPKNKTFKNVFFTSKKNGGDNTIVLEQNTLEVKKNELVESFKIFDEIFEQMKQKSKIPSYLNFKMSKYIDGIAMIIYSNPFIYPKFEDFYEELLKNHIVQCDDCIHYTISLPGTGTALYKVYKVYFVLGFIISYYYRNPHKFINEEYLKKKQLNSTLLFFKDVLTNLLCNNLYQTSKHCNIPMGFETFIRINNFNVNENMEITKAVFFFFNSIKKIPIIRNFESIHVFIDNFVDPNLDPNVYPQ